MTINTSSLAPPTLTKKNAGIHFAFHLLKRGLKLMRCAISKSEDSNPLNY